MILRHVYFMSLTFKIKHINMDCVQTTKRPYDSTGKGRTAVFTENTLLFVVL